MRLHILYTAGTMEIVFTTVNESLFLSWWEPLRPFCLKVAQNQQKKTWRKFKAVYRAFQTLENLFWRTLWNCSSCCIIMHSPIHIWSFPSIQVTYTLVMCHRHYGCVFPCFYDSLALKIIKLNVCTAKSYVNHKSSPDAHYIWCNTWRFVN